jgi:hypothetical protein
MIIEVVSATYREEFLAPLFLQHYETWVDRITLTTQKLTSGKFDDEDKMNWINESLARSTADWVVLVDMDEFVYPQPYGSDYRAILEQERSQGKRMIYSHMTRMWRHHSDKNIDRTKPPVPQRLHGIPDHVKPCIFDPHGVSVGAGNHDYRAGDHRPTGTPWAGAHWANADPCFWIERETRDRGPRLSERNISRGHGTHTRRTREQILQECRDHENDPQIIFLG